MKPPFALVARNQRLGASLGRRVVPNLSDRPGL
jgi:hypothetical protein